jgi:hypothetical protein
MYLFLSLISFTFNIKAEVWQLGNVTYNLSKSAEGYLVNQICIEKKKCIALEQIHKLKMNQFTFKNKNPGSEICLQTRGDVFIAFKGKKSQAFCRYSDQSIISLDAFLKKADS